MPHLKIVIDDGSNFIKFAYEKDGETVINSIPSRVVRKAIITPCGGGYSPNSYKVGGKFYSVSETAKGAIPTNNREYQTSEENRVLINHVVKLTGAATAELILTLPVSQFFNPDKSLNTGLIEAKKENAAGDLISLDKSDLAKITAVYVMPEGVPAFSHAKKSLNLNDGRFLIADVGGTTTDLLIFAPDSSIEEFKSLNIGALNMINHFEQLVIAKLSLDELTDAQKFNGLVTGTVAGQDVSDQVKICVNEFETAINDNIKQFGSFALFDAVIYSGGGALLLNKSDHVVQTDAPQFDNAKGALSAFGG